MIENKARFFKGVATSAILAALLSGCGSSSTGGDSATDDDGGLLDNITGSNTIVVEKNDNGEIQKATVKLKESISNSGMAKVSITVDNVKKLSGYYDCKIVSASGIPATLTEDKNEAEIKFGIASGDKKCEVINYMVLSGYKTITYQRTGSVVKEKWSKVVTSQDFDASKGYDLLPDSDEPLLVRKFQVESVSFTVVPLQEGLDIDVESGYVKSKNENFVFIDKDGKETYRLDLKNMVSSDGKIVLTIKGKYLGADEFDFDIKMKNGKEIRKSVPIDVLEAASYLIETDPSEINVVKYDTRPLKVKIYDPDSPDKPVDVTKIVVYSENGNVKIDDKTRLEKEINGKISDITFSIYGLYTGQDVIKIKFFTKYGGEIESSIKASIEGTGAVYDFVADVGKIKKGEEGVLKAKLVRKDSPDKPISLDSVIFKVENKNALFVQGGGNSDTFEVSGGNLYSDEDGIHWNGSILKPKLIGVNTGPETIYVTFNLSNGAKVKEKIELQIGDPISYGVSVDDLSQTSVYAGGEGFVNLVFSAPNGNDGAPVSKITVSTISGNAVFTSQTYSVNAKIKEFKLPFKGEYVGSDKAIIKVFFENGTESKVVVDLDIKSIVESYSIKLNELLSKLNVKKGERGEVVVDIENKESNGKPPVDVEKIRIFVKDGNVKLVNGQGQLVDEIVLDAQSVSNLSNSQRTSVNFEGVRIGTDAIVYEVTFKSGEKYLYKVDVSSAEETKNVTIDQDRSKLSVQPEEEGNLVLLFNDGTNDNQGVDVNKIKIHVSGDAIALISPSEENINGKIKEREIKFKGKYPGTASLTIDIEFKDGTTSRVSTSVTVAKPGEISIEPDLTSKTKVDKNEEGEVIFNLSRAGEPDRPVFVKKVYVYAGSDNIELIKEDGSAANEYVIDVEKNLKSIPVRYKGVYAGDSNIRLIVKDKNGDKFEKTVNIKVNPPVSFDVTTDPSSLNIKRFDISNLTLKFNDPRGDDRKVNVQMLEIFSKQGNVTFIDGGVEKSKVSVVPGEVKDYEVIVKGLYKGSDEVVANVKFANGTEKSIAVSVAIQDPDQVVIGFADGEAYDPYVAKGKVEGFKLSVTNSDNPDKEVAVSKVILEVVSGKTNLSVKDPASNTYGESAVIENIQDPKAIQVFVLGEDTGKALLKITAELENGMRIEKTLDFNVVTARTFGRITIIPSLENTTFDDGLGMFKQKFYVVLKDMSYAPIANKKVDLNLISHIIKDKPGNILAATTEEEAKSASLSGNVFEYNKNFCLPGTCRDLDFANVAQGDVLALLPKGDSSDNPEYLGGWSVLSVVNAKDPAKLSLNDIFAGNVSNLAFAIGNDQKYSECHSTLYRSFVIDASGNKTDEVVTDENGVATVYVAFPPVMTGNSAILSASAFSSDDGYGSKSSIRTGNAYRFGLAMDSISLSIYSATEGPNNTVDAATCDNPNGCDYVFEFKVKTGTKNVPMEDKVFNVGNFYISGCSKPDANSNTQFYTECEGKFVMRLVPSSSNAPCVVRWRGTIPVQ